MAKKGKEQIIIKICCVIAAFILWLYTSNDENITKTYKISNIPVEIINGDYLIQSGLIISPDQKLTTSLNITGKPSEIYSVKPEQFKLVADVSGYVMKKGENRVPVSIAQRPNGNFNIINDGAMWITIIVDNYAERTLPIEADVSGSSKNGYYNENPIVSPNTVRISGAETYVNSVDRVVAKLKIDNLDKDISRTVSLKALDKLGNEVNEVTLSPNKAEVLVSVNKTKEVGINIKTSGSLNSKFILKGINLSKDKVTISGDDKTLANISSLETEPIDLSKLEKEKESVKVKLIVPENVKIVGESNIIDGEVVLDDVVEKNIASNIEVINLKDGLSAQLNIKSLSMVISGGSSTIKNVDPEDIRCYVNLNNLDEGEYTMPIRIELPQGVNIISQGTKFVDVKIVKRDGNSSGNGDNASGHNAEDSNN